ncbi:MAG: hypothetical protein DMF00_06735 [Verrucomicrobia bacterium]|nr:MAG: hypothetical protein DMF00_06735 [Verrucomicrobiota bacterium]
MLLRGKIKPCWNFSKLQRVTFSPPKKKKAWATTFFAADNSKWITRETLLISRGYIRLYRQQERETKT